MATVSQVSSNLQPPGQDEDMDISSSYGRLDEDIDIDIDFSGEPAHNNQEDDYMVDDAPQERLSGTIQDDVMVDEDTIGNDIEDGVMQDDEIVPDEHLTDASEMGETNESVIPPTASGGTLAEQTSQSQGDPIPVTTQQTLSFDLDDTKQNMEQLEPDGDGEVLTVTGEENENKNETRVLDDSSANANGESSTENIKRDNLDQEQPSGSPDKNQTESGDPELINASETILETKSSDIDESSTQHHDSAPQEDKEEVSQEVQQENPEIDTIDDRENQTITQDEAEISNGNAQGVLDDRKTNQAEALEDGHPIHPCIVVYHSDEIFLFPPHDNDSSNTFFLSDESLLFQSIGDLLRACRMVLGETITLEDELELSIHELGLTITEDSAHAFTTTFSQVLDVYVQLHRHDGVQNPEPLYVTLATKTRFSTRLARLNDAVSSGKGISQLDFVNLTTEDDDVQPESTSRSGNLAADAMNQSKEDEDDPKDFAEGTGETSNLDPDTTSHSSSDSNQENHNTIDDDDEVAYGLADEDSHRSGSSSSTNNDAFDQDKYAEQVHDLDEHANDSQEEDGSVEESDDLNLEAQNGNQKDENEDVEDEDEDEDADEIGQEDSNSGSSETSTLQGDIADASKQEFEDNSRDNQDADDNDYENFKENYNTYLDNTSIEGLGVVEESKAIIDIDESNYALPEPTEDTFDFGELTNDAEDESQNDLKQVEPRNNPDSNDPDYTEHNQSHPSTSANITAPNTLAAASEILIAGDPPISENFDFDENFPLEQYSELDNAAEFQLDDDADINQYVADFDGVDYEDHPQTTSHDLQQTPPTKRSLAEYDDDSSVVESSDTKRVKSTNPE